MLARVLGLGLDDVARNGERMQQRLFASVAASSPACWRQTMAYNGGVAWARYELARDEALLDHMLARATAVTSSAVACRGSSACRAT